MMAFMTLVPLWPGRRRQASTFRPAPSSIASMALFLREPLRTRRRWSRMPPEFRETSKNGRSAASEQHHPRPRSGPACADLLCACPRRFGDRHERVEVRRLRVRDGAQSVGRRPAARLPAIHAQPRADRQGGPRAAGQSAGPHPGQRRRDGAVAGQAGARHGLLRHRVPAHLDGGRGRQRGRRLPLSAHEERARSTSRPASAATARPRPRATGASASRSTTRRPTSGRSTRRARFSASCRSRTPRASRTSTTC